MPPCPRQPGIGLDAINDALLLEACVYRLLKLCCRQQPYYLNLLELFLQVRRRPGLWARLSAAGTASGVSGLGVSPGSPGRERSWAALSRPVVWAGGPAFQGFRESPAQGPSPSSSEFLSD